MLSKNRMMKQLVVLVVLSLFLSLFVERRAGDGHARTPLIVQDDGKFERPSGKHHNVPFTSKFCPLFQNSKISQIPNPPGGGEACFFFSSPARENA